MKTFSTSLKRQDGFTLVELMVVVAIIGLLSAVAIPNFKKYQAKAKISEAKLQLSALYTAETAFFSDYNMYAACLRYMGFDPQKETANRYYSIGFGAGIGARNTSAHDAAVNSGMQGTGVTGCPNATAAKDGNASAADNDVTYFPAGKGVGGALVNTAALMTANAAGTAGTCTAATPTGGNCVGTQADTANMSFIAGAVGFISADFITGANGSGLTIDNNKVLRTLVNGF
jgi:type IV pilus assembly protein PilA